METSVGAASSLQKLLLACGLVAPLISVLMDQILGRLVKGYNFTVQSISELSAAGSPTRSLALVVLVVTSALLIAFGIGIWRSGSASLLPRVVGGLVIGNAALSLIAMLFFPNRYGVQPVFASPGVLLMFGSVLCSVLAFVFGAIAFGGWLRVLSVAVPAAFVLLAILRFATAASDPGGASASTGAQERTMAYAFQLWLMALAAYLLRIQPA
jgi:hypothetical protein